MADRSITVRLGANVQGFVSAFKTAEQAAKDFGSRSAAYVEKHGASLEKVGATAAVMGGAIVAGVGVAIKKYADFDQAMSEVQASTHETAANMGLLREAAIEAGADTAFSAKEAAQGIDELAKAGISTQDVLNGGLTGALSLAAAGGLAVGDAAEIAATALTQFKLAGKDIPHVADLLAAGAGKAQGSVQDMGMALKQSGLVASQVGLTIEETTGGLAAFASAGLIGSDAGTSFKSMLQRLTPQSKEAQRAMDELGISAYDSQGNFVGLEQFAGNLAESMKDLTVQQRNAAMTTIFGSDAVRAAAVLYDQGAAGVKTWISAVDDAGFAAETARIKQDNLAGDIEKLGGSFDTVFIKGGGSAAESLRGLVQAAEKVVDTVGQIPAPMLGAGVAVAGVVGGVALLGGGLLSVLPRIVSVKNAVQELRPALGKLSSEHPKTVSALTAIGKAAGVAATAFTVATIASATFTRQTQANVDKSTSDMLDLAKSGTKVSDIFGADSFLNANKISPTADKISSLGDALKKVTDINFRDTLTRGATEFFNTFGAKESTQLMETSKAIEGMDAALTNLVTGGHQEDAALAFTKIVQSGTDAGVAVDKTAGQFSGYINALRKQSNQLKVNLSDEKLYQWALGNTPAEIEAVTQSQEGAAKMADIQAQATEEAAKALEKVGLFADGTIASLDKLVESMFATGLANLSAKDATGAFHESLRDLDEAAKKVLATQKGVNRVLTEAGTDFDVTTASGYAASGVFAEVAQKGANMTDAMAKNGATQGELQGSLKKTYDGLIAAAGKFDITGDAADTLARKALGVPKGVSIDTAIQNFADSMAKLRGVGSEADKLNGKTANIWIATHLKSIYSEEHESTGRGGQGGQTKMAGGGAVHGGIPGVDSVPILGMQGEHMLDTSDVQAMGGQAGVYRFRQALHSGASPDSAGVVASPVAAKSIGGLLGIDYDRLADAVTRRMSGPQAVVLEASQMASFLKSGGTEVVLQVDNQTIARASNKGNREMREGGAG